MKAKTNSGKPREGYLSHPNIYKLNTLVDRLEGKTRDEILSQPQTDGSGAKGGSIAVNSGTRHCH